MNLALEQRQVQDQQLKLQCLFALRQELEDAESEVEAKVEQLSTMRAKWKRFVRKHCPKYRQVPWKHSWRRMAYASVLAMLMVGCRTPATKPAAHVATPQSIKASLAAKVAAMRAAANHRPFAAVVLPPPVQTITYTWDQRDGDGFAVPLPYTNGNQWLEYDFEYRVGPSGQWTLFGSTVTNFIRVPTNLAPPGSLVTFRVGNHFR